jgi:hypothetical protein
VGGDDEVVCAAGSSRCAGSGPIGRPYRRVGQLDPDPVLGDRDGGHRELVLIEGCSIDVATFVLDQYVRIQDRAPSHGSRSWVVSNLSASVMSSANRSSGGTVDDNA